MMLCMRVTKSPESEIGFNHYKEFSGQGGVIGRSERCDWWLPDRSNIISNQHMFIRNQDNQFYVVDNSTNGTSLGNEEKDALIPGKPYLLTEGSEIAIGEYVISIEKIGSNEEKQETTHEPSSLTSNLESELPFLNPHAETDLERLIQNEQQQAPQSNTQRIEDKFNAWANPVPPFQSKPQAQPSRFAPFETATLNDSPEAASAQAVQEAPQRPQPRFDHFQQETISKQEPQPFTGLQQQEPVQRTTRTQQQVPAFQQKPIVQQQQAKQIKAAPASIASTGKSNFLNTLSQRFNLSQDVLHTLGEEQVIEIVSDLVEGSLEGFIELLIARAKIKNDLNVDMTMIQSEENNILKHSVHAKQAISLFLQPQSDSFLPAKMAIKDAVKDIKQHQRALFESVKKSLHSTLDSVDPHTIEKQISETKRYFFPGKKYKADCWKDYSKRFQGLQQNDGQLLYEQFLGYFAENYQEKTQS